MFMGTPDFAIPCLEALNDRFDLCAVVTQPDKPKGRGYAIVPPPVKVFATDRGIPCYQPSTLKNGAFLETLEEISPDVIVVVAYGKILPDYVLDFPKFGCVNVHGSLLPEYRGAAPMQRAIIDGKKQTGITTMYMASGLDTGDMLEKAYIEITEEDDFESVHDKLADLGAKLIISTLEKLTDGSLVPEKQDERLATYAAKIEKEDCVLSFDRSVDSVHDRIRGLSPIPLAFSYLNGRMIKFIKSRIVSRGDPSTAPGTVVSLSNGAISIACADGIIAVCDVLPEGKSRMSSAAFINGRQIDVGDVFKGAKL